ncbi:MAG: glycosyltransferase family A protein [Acidobacteriaceae bacterium]|jgi:cellulose synthase/poly-beta-1,6-N-acetylglucosamine synthase-like glycosyltransferase
MANGFTQSFHPALPLMHLGMQIGAWFVALAWLSRLLEAMHGLPTIPNLAEARIDRDAVSAPRLTVIVPARDEAAMIGACLESLLNQDCPELYILAVDDRSDDATREIIEVLATQNPTRLKAIHITDLPPRWLGKTHAMALGARRAIAEGAALDSPPDYLLFTDADVVFISRFFAGR